MASMIIITDYYVQVAVIQPSIISGETEGIALITFSVLSVVSFILISLEYGIMREYIFEVTILSIVWLELIISSLLMSRVFKNYKTI